MKKTIQTLQDNPESGSRPIKETREQAGIRLALDRMPKLRKRLRLIGNLGAYPLGDRRVELLIQTIRQWVNECEVLLRNHNSGQNEFHF